MDVDPMEIVEDVNEEREDAEERRERTEKDRRKSQLNGAVAIAVACLATFMGIARVKADNIGQAMSQAQAKSVDTWSWYQAKKIRQQSAEQAMDTFDVQAAATRDPAALAVIAQKRAKYQGEAARQKAEVGDVEKQAKDYDKTYDALNVHDDQFDLSDALLAIAISLFAVTSLTQKRWLFLLALLPTFWGVLYGLAGLLGWGLHSTLFAKLLGT